MKNSTQHYDVQKEYRELVTTSFAPLVQYKKEEDKTAFNALILKISPTLKNYISERLNRAIRKGYFSKNKFSVNDILDQLFIEIYDNVDRISSETEFYLWLFKKTNQLLDDCLLEEEFDDQFIKNIDDFSKPEWDAMQEQFSTDGDGDLLMIEELDDMSYNHNDYTLNQVFIEDNETGWIEKIDKRLSAEEIERHIKLVLANLPGAMANVFQLFSKQHLRVEEIARIRNNTVQEVQHLLNEAKRILQVSFFNRYPRY